jgi:hypothetical protein
LDRHLVDADHCARHGLSVFADSTLQRRKSREYVAVDSPQSRYREAILIAFLGGRAHGAPLVRNRAENPDRHGVGCVGLHGGGNFVERLHAKLKMPKLRLDATAIDPLSAYAWPGNVRELENAIEHAGVLSRNGAITPELLPTNVVLGTGAHPGSAGGSRSLGQVERDHIRAVLAESGGNRTRAATVLGISPTTLWRRLKVADRS